MQRSTWMLIGAVVIALGIGVMALGFVGQDATVRQVADMLAAPDAHRDGAYVLIGIPQPETVLAEDGEVANPDRAVATVRVTAWSRDGVLHHSTHTTSVIMDAAGSAWTYRNDTRVAGAPAVVASSNMTWRLDGPHTVFQIDGFPDANGDVPRMWGVYDGLLRDPVQPKPSQFEGRLADHLGGVLLPPDALVFQVDVYTAGCSSKFLPDDHQDQATA